MRLNQNGLSLIEITIAAALTSVVALSAAFVVSRSQQVAHFSTLQNDIDRIHYLNLQAARNVANVQIALGIDSSSPNGGDNDLLTCLRTQPTGGKINCLAYNDPSTHSYSLNPALLIQDTANGIHSQVTFQPHCVVVDASGLQGCDAITVTVSTAYQIPGSGSNGAAPSFANRTSVSNMPNYLFIPRNQINYKCTTPGLLSGIDYYNQAPICSGGIESPLTDGSGNTSNLPLVLFDSGSSDVWSPANTVACPYGYVSAGFGTATCRTSPDLTAAPAPTTTTVPAPTTTVAVNNIPINCMDDDPCTYAGQVHIDHGQSCMCPFLGGNPHFKAHGVCKDNGDGTWSLIYVQDSATVSVYCM